MNFDQSGVGQEFDVAMHNCQTGERWEVTVTAADPPAALQKVLRRRHFAEALLSEQMYRFIVSDRLDFAGSDEDRGRE